MNKQNDILNNAELKANPFKMPEGYVEGLESALHEKISNGKAESRGWRGVLKPVAYLAAMFAIVFGMGYGVLALTHTSEKMHLSDTESIAEIENGWINSSFIDFYNEELEASNEEDLSDEEIINYLTDELTFNQIASYLAQE